MTTVKTTGGMAMAALLLMTCSGISSALANCPIPTQGQAAKYTAFYVQSPDNAGSSWRLFIRPRNGACLAPAGTGYQSPVNTMGQTDGKQTAAAFHDGAHNCSTNYKSYIGVAIPSAIDVYNTFTTFKTAAGQPMPTTVGFKIMNTKNSGYSGAIFVVPMKKPDGTYDNASTKILGICIN